MSFNIVSKLFSLLHETKGCLGLLVSVKGKLLCVLAALQTFVLLHRYFVVDVYYACVPSYDGTKEIRGGTVPNTCMTLSGYGFLKRNNELLIALACLHCLSDGLFAVFLTVQKINILLTLFIFKCILCLRYVYFAAEAYNCMLPRLRGGGDGASSVWDEIKSIYNYNNTCLFVYPHRFRCVIETEIINFGREERYVCYNSDYETLNYFIFVNLFIHIFGSVLYIFYITHVTCSKMLSYYRGRRRVAPSHDHCV